MEFTLPSRVIGKVSGKLGVLRPPRKSPGRSSVDTGESSSSMTGVASSRMGRSELLCHDGEVTFEEELDVW
jgi:hypothetical protein